ncbi:DUF3168 domain-containing protein [Rhizobiaceae bacterium BDR2-2]|uniref:DUF3168 domain-containing protein n=1 Tax=Ectorhizobium quercum TaxID=2965071 RepID=A0AAE3MZZ3_9HYPH|nr:DUF3168 domain-containing protein [Ectorhizobium quercum]MCX8998463.1 DUF3168 domain-containing protein [Ectorhizobium quercum]
MSAANALLMAIHDRLSGDAELVSLTGGRVLIDRLADRTPLPLVALGDMESRDWSTGTDSGEEHLFSLVVWSEAAGRREAAAIATRIRALLDDAPLALDGAHLVGLLHRTTRTRREPKSGRFVAELSFRAVTEEVS